MLRWRDVQLIVEHGFRDQLYPTDGSLQIGGLLRSTSAEFGFHQKVSLSRRLGHLALAQMLRLAEA
jgi:hypothetical protein